jgi:D-glycero-alpha-D-manno-heptose 1-phosphate guanylyltransferase
MSECIILAGGFGTRLRGVISDRPKSLAPVNGKPFIYWLLKNLKRTGVNKFYLSLGYEADKIVEEIFKWREEFDISSVIEKVPLDTGGALNYCMKHFNIDEAIVANGDTYIDGNLENFLKPLNLIGGELIRVGTVLVRDRQRYGGVEVNDRNIVVSMSEKGVSSPGMINAGIYRVNIRAFMSEKNEIFSFERSTLPRLIFENKVTATFIKGSFIDIGIPEDYKLFSENFSDG